MKKSILLPIILTAIVISSCGPVVPIDSSDVSVFPRFSTNALKNAIKASPASTSKMKSQLADLKIVNNSLKKLASSSEEKNCSENSDSENSLVASNIISISQAIPCLLNAILDEVDKVFITYSIVPTIGDSSSKIDDIASYIYKIDSTFSTFEIMPESTSNTLKFYKLKIIWNKADKKLVLAATSPESEYNDKSQVIINAYQDASGGINFTVDSINYNHKSEDLPSNADASYNNLQKLAVGYDTVSKTFALVTHALVIDASTNAASLNFAKANVAKPGFGFFFLGNEMDKILYASQKTFFSKDITYSNEDSNTYEAIYCGSDYINSPTEETTRVCKAGETAGDILARGYNNINYLVNHHVTSDNLMNTFLSSMSEKSLFADVNAEVEGIGGKMNRLYNDIVGELSP